MKVGDVVMVKVSEETAEALKKKYSIGSLGASACYLKDVSGSLAEVKEIEGEIVAVDFFDGWGHWLFRARDLEVLGEL
jgi:hypothetical protein